MLGHHPKDDEPGPLPFKGSIMTLLTETKEEAIAILKKDPYTVNNVWDWEKVCAYS